MTELIAGKNIAELWDLCLPFEYNEDKIVNSLDKYLQKYKGKEILYCACGTGFVIQKLIQTHVLMFIKSTNSHLNSHLNSH